MKMLRHGMVRFTADVDNDDAVVVVAGVRLRRNLALKCVRYIKAVGAVGRN
jgi:hypothetical protein